LIFPIVTISEFDGVRCLHLDTPWIQGSMRIKEPYLLELEYIQRMMVWLLFVDHKEFKSMRAVQLGLGSAAITKFCYKILGMRTSAIEINPKVTIACRQWFKLPPDNKRLEIILADAGKEIKLAKWQSAVDALSVDLYDHEAAIPVMDSEAFYADCRAALTPSGAMTVNLFGRDHSYESSLKKLRCVFGSSNVWAFKPTREGNTIVLALKSSDNISRETLMLKAEFIESAYGLPAKKWLKIFKPIE
jgi:spermidine synthase